MRLFSLILITLSSFAIADIDDSFDDSFDANADDVVEFHIVKGTGNKPWNTKETAVEVKVGQTLRIINDDNAPHYLHTPGRPCSHGSGPFGARRPLTRIEGPPPRR